MYFIFHEYFTEDDLDWEACRQSIVLRSLKINEGGLAEDKIKSLFPFKCKTEVVEVGEGDDIVEVLADTMAQCWYTYGEGGARLYGDDWLSADGNCFVCARLKFGEDVLLENRKIEIGDYLSTTVYEDGETYLDYIYGKEPSEDIGALKEAIKETYFISNQGDIFVMFVYVKGQRIGPESEPWKSLGTKQYLAIFPEKYSERFLDTCTHIETIPA